MPNEVFLGRYEAIKLLGEGGMGRVYLARNQDGSREVVVKVLRPDVVANQKSVQAFQREIDCMTRFRHPNVVEFYESSLNDPSGPCIVMEYVPGEALDERLGRQGRMRADRVGLLLGQLCSALQAAHARGIIHRDLKPENVMVVDDGTVAGQLKILDFGLASLDFQNAGQMYIPVEQLTSTTARPIMGTPEYLCPELAKRQPMDHRGDLYSVGVIIFQLLTGRRPFERPTVEATLLAHVYDPVPYFDSYAPGSNTPPAVEAVVRTCLEKDPADRPQNAWDLARAYQEALGKQIFFDEQFLPPMSEMIESDAGAPASIPEDDPHAVIFDIEARMPESIAVMKLRGFLDAHKAEVLDSVPGVLRVRLKRPCATPRQAPPPKRGIWSLLGLGKPEEDAPADHLIALDVHFRKEESGQLLITLVLRPTEGTQMSIDGAWLQWCERIYKEMKAYVM
jgi:serine/threonine-protein kinase